MTDSWIVTLSLKNTDLDEWIATFYKSMPPCHKTSTLLSYYLKFANK